MPNTSTPTTRAATGGAPMLPTGEEHQNVHGESHEHTASDGTKMVHSHPHIEPNHVHTWIQAQQLEQHAQDHRDDMVAFRHAATTRPLTSEVYARRRANAEAGCPGCCAFVVGATRDAVAVRVKAGQYPNLPSQRSAQVTAALNATGAIIRSVPMAQRSHFVDHARFALTSDALTEAIKRREYQGIHRQAERGCTLCAAWIAGAMQDDAAGKAIANLVALAHTARILHPATTRQAIARTRVLKTYEEALRVAGDRAVADLKQLPGESAPAFLLRQAQVRGAAEIAFTGSIRAVYGTTAPDGSQTPAYDAGQLNMTKTGPAGNGSVSPVISVTPQQIGGRVLYNTEDAAALMGGVPAAAEERPTPDGDYELNPESFHEGGHQYGPDAFANVPKPVFTGGALPPRAPQTVKNSGTPNVAGKGQVWTVAQRMREVRRAGEEAAESVVQLPNEPVDVFIARRARAIGKAEEAIRLRQRGLN